MTRPVAIAALVLSVLIGVVGQICFKYGAMRSAGGLRTFFEPAVLIGFLGYGLSAAIYVLTLQQLPLSLAYPTVAGGYVVVFAAGYFLFGELISFRQVAGLALVCLGVFLLWR